MPCPGWDMQMFLVAVINGCVFGDRGLLGHSGPFPEVGKVETPSMPMHTMTKR